MFDGINNFPLTWPMTWPRTEAWKRKNAQFADRSIAKAVDKVLDELRMLNARDIIISTNLQLRQDGLPRSAQKRPGDPGVAVYFTIKSAPRVLACDKWFLVEDNLWAIAKHIEALRGQQRWGVGSIDQAFAGYPALPAGNWWEWLGVDRGAREDEIRTAFRTLAKNYHPDVGGNQEDFLKIQAAFDQAIKEKGNG